jgi:hypothetical protein
MRGVILLHKIIRRWKPKEVLRIGRRKVTQLSLPKIITRLFRPIQKPSRSILRNTVTILIVPLLTIISESILNVSPTAN